MGTTVEDNHSQYYKNAEIGQTGDLWNGPDGRTVYAITIQPHETISVPVEIPNSRLAKEVLFSDSDWEIETGAHTSSRVIQFAVVTPHDTGRKLDERQANNHSKTIQLDVELASLANRPVTIEQGASLFNAYYSNGRALEGDALSSQINTNNGGIKIDGEEGKDWMWHVDENGSPVRIICTINSDPTTRLWLPPSTEPVTVIAAKKHYFRAQIDEESTLFSQQMPPTDTPTLWVGVTPHLRLPRNIHVRIPTLDQVPNVAAVQDVKLLNGNGNEGQQNSPLLTGRRTDWPPRVEIFSVVDSKDNIPEAVFYAFPRAARLKVRRSSQ